MGDITFDRLMTHKLNLRKLERNSRGDYSTIETYSNLDGFVEYGVKETIKKDGEETNAKAIVYLKSDCDIDPNYDYWAIDQTYPQTRSNLIVLQIDPIDDPRNGNTHHFECVVK